MALCLIITLVWMTPEVCRNKRSCGNLYKDKAVTLDTNVLLNIIKAINRIISEKTLEENDLFDTFTDMLEGYLVVIRLCAFNRGIYVSKEIFSKEMNPLLDVSTLRQSSIFNTLCGNSCANYRRVERLLKRNFTISRSAVPTSTTNELKRSVRRLRTIEFTMPSDNDLSLLALTFELSTNVAAMLLTDDTSIRDAIEAIQRSMHITLSRQQFDTSKIGYAGSLSYMSEIYTCCKLLPPRFFAVFDVLSNFVESSSGSLSIRTIKAHSREFNQVLRDISEIPKQPGEM